MILTLTPIPSSRNPIRIRNQAPGLVRRTVSYRGMLPAECYAVTRASVSMDEDRRIGQRVVDTTITEGSIDCNVDGRWWPRNCPIFARSTRTDETARGEKTCRGTLSRDDRSSAPIVSRRSSSMSARMRETSGRQRAVCRITTYSAGWFWVGSK